MKLLAPVGEPGATARPRSSAQHVAMAAAALWLVLCGVLHVTTSVIVPPLFSLAPLIAATVADERRTAVFAGTAVVLGIGAVWWQGLAGDMAYQIRVAALCAISAMAVVVAGMRRRREERLARMHRGRGGRAARAAAAAAAGDDRDHHRGPLPLRDTRGLGRRGSV